MFELKDLHLTAGGRVLLQRQSLAHPGAPRLLLSGPSGCGKSTLLRVLAGLAHPAGGTLLWHGQPVVRGGLAVQRRRVHRVEQQPLLPGASVREALVLGLELRGLPLPADTRLREELAALGLAQLPLEQDPARLSGGEALRVAVLRGLLLPVELLLLDEPSAGLDDVAVALLRERLTRPDTPALLVAGHDPRLEGLCPARWSFREGALHVD